MMCFSIIHWLQFMWPFHSLQFHVLLRVLGHYFHASHQQNDWVIQFLI